MSIRTYLGVISNDHLNQIRDLPSISRIKEVVNTWNPQVDMSFDMRQYLCVSTLPDRVIDQVGDIVFQPEYGIPKIPFFSRKRVQEKVTDENALFLLPQESLLLLIKAYHHQTAKHLRKIVDNAKEMDNFPGLDGECCIDTPIEVLSQEARMWGEYRTSRIVNTNLDDIDNLAVSGHYEHGIFTLAHLYKSFDFDNETLFVMSY